MISPKSIPLTLAAIAMIGTAAPAFAEMTLSADTTDTILDVHTRVVHKSGHVLKGECPATKPFQTQVITNGVFEVTGRYTDSNGNSSQVMTVLANGNFLHDPSRRFAWFDWETTISGKGPSTDNKHPLWVKFQSFSPQAKSDTLEIVYECLEPPREMGLQSNTTPKPKPDLVKAAKIMIGGKSVNQNGVVELTKADSLGMNDNEKCVFVANWMTANEGEADAGRFTTVITENGQTEGTKGHSGLKAGANAQGSTRLYLANGLHVLNFETDKANQVAESDEGNNNQGVRLTVAGCNPDTQP